jgi:hypothetical protein
MQEDYSAAVLYFKQMFGMPTKKSLIAQINGATTAAEKRQIQQNYDKMLKLAKDEASLYNIEQVKYLAWEPDLTVKGHPKFNADKTLKGKYICQYENDNGN